MCWGKSVHCWTLLVTGYVPVHKKASACLKQTGAPPSIRLHLWPCISPTQQVQVMNQTCCLQHHESSSKTDQSCHVGYVCFEVGECFAVLRIASLAM